MATTLLPSEALRRPRRLDVRLVAGVFLALAAFIGTLGAYASLSASRDVLVAARDLPAGAVLTADDLQAVAVRLDDQTYRAAVPADERASLAGRTLAAPVFAREVLARAQFDARPALAPGEEAYVIALPPDTAVGARFQAGDDVQVLWVEGGKGAAAAQAVVLLDRAKVLDVAHQPSGVVASVGVASAAPPAAIAAITLAVSHAQVVELAMAKVSGQLDVARLPPLPEPASR